MGNGTNERGRPPELLGFVIALMLGAPAHAETEVAADDKPWTAGVIVVTALAPTAPLTVETDPKQPRQPVPASDGADYLKTIPGFAVLRNGGTNGDPVLRGMFGSRLNLLTNDGTMVGACPARMDNALSYVSPETYDVLTVIKGPQSVIWGPGGSAGTVRFERRTAPFAAGAGVRGDASALVGSWGRRDVLVDATIGSPTVFARATANRAESDDYEDGNGNRVPSRWYKWSGDFTLGWTPDADTRLEATVGAGDGEARYAGRSMDGSQFRRESAGVRFEKGGFSGALQRIEANAFYNYADHVMDNYSLRTPDANGPMPTPVAADVDRRTTGGRVATHWEWQPLKLIVGADHQRNQHRGRSGMGIDTYCAEPWVPDARFSTTGLFAETTVPLDARQRLVAGARADRASTTDQRLVAGMMSMPNPTANERRRDTLASAFLRYERELEASPVAVYAGVGSVERFPDYWELFSSEMATMGAVNPFRAVKPERTTQLDVGAQYVGTAVNAWVSLYAGRADDFILFRYSEGGMMGPMSQVENIEARTRGGELGVAWRASPAWKLQGTLAYAWGENATDHRALPQTPPLEARLSADYARNVWSFGALWRLVAAQNRVALDEGNVVGRDLGPSAGFGVFSINGGYRFGESVRLTVGIDNLFDRAYTEHLNLAGDAAFGYPADPVRINEPGRMVWTKVNVKF
jgi:iron complex outermembrane receptor protein